MKPVHMFIFMVVAIGCSAKTDSSSADETDASSADETDDIDDTGDETGGDEAGGDETGGDETGGDETDTVLPVSDVWTWQMGAETGGDCLYGTDYTSVPSTEHLLLQRHGEHFTIGTGEVEPIVCTLSGADFVCEDIPAGVYRHDGIVFEGATDHTLVSLHGSFGPRDAERYSTMTGTYTRTHDCRGHQCDELAGMLGADFSFPCDGSGSFEAAVAH